MALDALTYPGTETNLAAVREQVRFVHADNTDAQPVMREHQIEMVVNFAAESHNSLAVLDPGRFFGPVCWASRPCSKPRGRWAWRGFTTSPPARYTASSTWTRPPRSPRTRRISPAPVQRQQGRRGSRGTRLPRDLRAPDHNHQLRQQLRPNQFSEKVLPLFTTHALEDRDLPVYASKHHRREWIHVSDHIRAIETLLQRGRVGHTYHVGTGVEASVEQIPDLVLDELGLPATRKREVPDRPGQTAATCWTPPRSATNSTGNPASPSSAASEKPSADTPTTDHGGNR